MGKKQLSEMMLASYPLSRDPGGFADAAFEVLDKDATGQLDFKVKESKICLFVIIRKSCKLPRISCS